LSPRRDRSGRYSSEPVERKISRSYTATVNQAMAAGYTPESALAAGEALVDGMVREERARRRASSSEPVK